MDNPAAGTGPVGGELDLCLEGCRAPHGAWLGVGVPSIVVDVATPAGLIGHLPRSHPDATTHLPGLQDHSDES